MDKKIKFLTSEELVDEYSYASIHGPEDYLEAIKQEMNRRDKANYFENPKDEEKSTSAYKCLRCDGEMRFYLDEQIQLGRTGLFLGDLSNLISGALGVRILVCEKCRKMEFFLLDE